MKSAITTSNYFDVIQENGLPDNDTLKAGHQNMVLVSSDNWAAYRADSEIKEATDLYFRKLEQYYDKLSGGKTPAPSAGAPEKKPKTKPAAKQKPAAKTKPAPKAKSEPKPAAKPTAKAAPQTAASKPASTKAAAKPAAKASAKPTPAASSKTGQSEGVYKLTPSVRLIRRFLGKSNKQVPLLHVNAVLRSLQTAITERDIKKNDLHAAEIEKIQELLVQVVNTAKTDDIFIEVGSDMLAKLTQKAGGEHVYGSVPVIKALTRFEGRKPTAKQLENLMKRATTAQKDDNDPYQGVLKDVVVMLAAAQRKGGTVVFDKRGLSGTSATAFNQLAGINSSLNKYSRHAAVYAKSAARTAARNTTASAGRSLLRASGKGDCGCAGGGVSGVKKPCGCKKKTLVTSTKAGLAAVASPTHSISRTKVPDFDPPSVTSLNRRSIMSSSDLMRQQFDVLEFWGKYRTLIGKPVRGFKMMLYGRPGQGKSTAAIDLARYTAAHHGPTLYVSGEEPNSFTLQEKLTRTGGSVKGLDFAGEIPSRKALDHYEYCFIDSVNNMNLTLADFNNLMEQHPNMAFILIFQTTKEGIFKGAQEWEHDVDVVIQVEKGKAQAIKNRFAPLSSITIF
jgi:hypothetical protein